MEDTIFHKILRGEIPATIVYEDDHVVAFKDIEPQAPVHVLVVPRTAMPGMDATPDHDAEILGHFMQGIAYTARALGVVDRGYRVVLNTGADALQSVPYIHAHILAGRRMEWPPG